MPVMFSSLLCKALNCYKTAVEITTQIAALKSKEMEQSRKVSLLEGRERELANENGRAGQQLLAFRIKSEFPRAQESEDKTSSIEAQVQLTNVKEFMCFIKERMLANK